MARRLAARFPALVPAGGLRSARGPARGRRRLRRRLVPVQDQHLADVLHGLRASAFADRGQRHFARGPTLKTAQATGCGGSIAELRAVLQSLTQTFSNQGEPKRPTVGRGISGFSTRKTPDSPGQCVPLAKPVRSFAPTPITKCTGRASGTLFQRAVNNQFRVRWWARQKD